MTAALRRIGAHAGYLLLLAGLALTAAALVTGVGRAGNRLADRALTHDVAASPHGGRDIFLRQRMPLSLGADPVHNAESLDRYAAALPPPLPALVGRSWFAGSVDTETIAPSGPQTRLELRWQTGVVEAARLTAGRWPANSAGPSDPARPIEIALSTQVAELLAAKPTDRLRVDAGGPVDVVLLLVGLFDPVDVADPVWDDMPLAVRANWPLPDQPLLAAAVTDRPGLADAAQRFDDLVSTWRFRVDERRLDGRSLDAVTTAAEQTRRVRFGEAIEVRTSLHVLLDRYAAQLRAVRSLLAVVLAGLLTTLAGLAWLAARLITERRRPEYGLLRARGASVAAVGARAGTEAVLVLPAAVLAGWLLGTVVGGRPTGWERWAVGLLAVLAVAALPVSAMLAHRRGTGGATRRDVAGERPSARVVTAEVSVVLAAVLGLYLVDRRGLSGSDVDGYLVAVPVLVAVAAAVVARRLLPWPLRRAGWLAAAARPAVPFLALAQAGRGAVVGTAPLAVLVVAVATGAFSGAVAASIDDARARATTARVPADAVVAGGYFHPEVTAAGLAALPGVTAVTGVDVEQAVRISTPRGSGQAQVLLVDGPALARVLARSRPGATVPAVLTDAARSGPVPAVVSPEVAAELGAGPRAGTAVLRSRPYDFVVGAVADSFPGIAAGSTRFVVLPWQALPAGAPIHPNRFLLAGTGFDPAAVRQVADAGQLAYQTQVLRQRPATTVALPATVTTWEQARAGLEGTGANGVLALTFATGAVGGTVLALFAVALSVLAGARSRGQVLSRLRTLGLSRRQGRAMLVVELVPVVGAAVLTGVAVGLLLPAGLRPALGLETFTTGVPTRVHPDPWLLAAGPVLVLLAIGTALAVEALRNRRLRLGELLRLGEEG